MGLVRLADGSWVGVGHFGGEESVCMEERISSCSRRRDGFDSPRSESVDPDPQGKEASSETGGEMYDSRLGDLVRDRSGVALFKERRVSSARYETIGLKLTALWKPAIEPMLMMQGVSLGSASLEGSALKAAWR